MVFAGMGFSSSCTKTYYVDRTAQAEPEHKPKPVTRLPPIGGSWVIAATRRFPDSSWRQRGRSRYTNRDSVACLTALKTTFAV
jgi:hypothetical protein